MDLFLIVSCNKGFYLTIKMSQAVKHCMRGHGRGAGVGRDLGVGVGLGVAVGEPLALLPRAALAPAEVADRGDEVPLLVGEGEVHEGAG